MKDWIIYYDTYHNRSLSTGGKLLMAYDSVRTSGSLESFACNVGYGRELRRTKV